MSGDTYSITQGNNTFETKEYFMFSVKSGKCISFKDNSNVKTSVCGSFIIQTN